MTHRPNPKHKALNPGVVAGSLLLLFLASLNAWADAGVLVPSNRTQPDPTILSLDEMWIDIRIDNGDARVRVKQIFGSHVGTVLEGNYVFALPDRAAVSDFAVWDTVTRIPGVILERKRAEEIYADLKWQALDPGLLQQGEYTAEEARRTSAFTARVLPIPPYGSKRLELEYHQSLPVENLQSLFALPLRPEAYQSQVANHLWINFELHSEHPLSGFAQASSAYPLHVSHQDAHLVQGTYEGMKVGLTEDFAIRYNLDGSHGDHLEVLTYRDPRITMPGPADAAPENPAPEPGFFEASALLTIPGSSSKAIATAAATGPTGLDGPPRTVVILFDTSLSMQWDKLDRSYQALEALLHSLRPVDRFNVVLFNTAVKPYTSAPAAADAAGVAGALDFVRSSFIRGGTDLERALEAGLSQTSSGTGERYMVLLSDGETTRGQIGIGKMAAWYDHRWRAIPAGERPRTYIFGVGDDTNASLLKILAREDGILAQVGSTEPIEFKLNAFISKFGRRPVESLALDATPGSAFDLIYPLEDTWFSGSVASWVGEYKRPSEKVTFTARGVRDGQPLKMSAKTKLPVEALDHDQLPRLWARARVDALLEKIDREGEDQASIDEIIRLSRKYKFVTPYTSFLAAPRALLRPRVIRPGDPILRVRTDPTIVSVVALFSFGLVKPLRYLKDDDIWQTRFLAPHDLADGTYPVRLILRDQMGHVYRESKSFIIVSHPPTVRVTLDQSRYRQGGVVRLRVGASFFTRHVVARLQGAAPVELHWNPEAESSTGQLPVPEWLPAGRYTVSVTAEDIAHNVGSREVPIEIIP